MLIQNLTAQRVFVPLSAMSFQLSAGGSVRCPAMVWDDTTNHALIVNTGTSGLMVAFFPNVAPPSAKGQPPSIYIPIGQSFLFLPTEGPSAAMAAYAAAHPAGAYDTTLLMIAQADGAMGGSVVLMRGGCQVQYPFPTTEAPLGLFALSGAPGNSSIAVGTGASG